MLLRKCLLTLTKTLTTYVHFFDPNVKCLEPTIKLGGETGKVEPVEIHYVHISNQAGNTSISCFSNVGAVSLYFYERSGMVFCYRKEVRREFLLLRKKAKSKKKAFSICFAVSRHRGSTPLAARVAPTSSCLENHARISTSSHHSVSI